MEQFKFPEWISNITNEKAREIISRYYQNQVAMGRDPEEFTALLKDFAETGTEHEELFSEANIFQKGFVIAHAEPIEHIESSDSAERAKVLAENPILMLSSSSKTFLLDAYLQLLKQAGVDLNNLILEVTTGAIKEIDRRIKDFGGEKTLEELLPDYVSNGELMPHEDLQNKFNEDALILDLNQIIYATLTLSANGVLGFLKQFLMESLKISEEELSLKVEEFFPGFRARVSDKILENRSNESTVRDFATNKLHQITQLRTKSDNVSELILKSITNSKNNFSFDFTSTPLAQNLIQGGYKVYEKTGSYMCEYWMDDISQQGFPPHAIYLTSVTIETPEGALKEFVYYELVEVPFSYQKVDPDNGMVTGWPDEDADGYIAYFDKLSEKIGPGFRQRMSEKIAAEFGISI